MIKVRTLDKRSLDSLKILDKVDLDNFRNLDGISGGLVPPIEDDELIEETVGVFDHLKFDEGGENEGFVLIQEA